MKNKILLTTILLSLFLVPITSAQVCPTIIGWKIVDDSCVSDSGCDYDFSGNTTYYGTEKMCLAILNGNYKYCEVNDDCRSLSGCDAGCWNTSYKPSSHIGEVCPTLLGPKFCKCYQNECTPTCSDDSDCDKYYVKCEEGEKLTCQKNLCLCQGECTKGETKDYTCPNGIKVPWCVCEDQKWVCIISPENQCMGYCRGGETKEYKCPDGKFVPWCFCENNQFVCIISPENQCPTTRAPEIVCPSWCTYSNNVCNCPVSNKTTEKIVIEPSEGQSIKIEITTPTKKEISIEKISEGKQSIKIEGVIAQTVEPIAVEEGKLYIETTKGKAQVKILPNEASNITINQVRIEIIKEINLKTEFEKLIYFVKGVKRAKIFGIIPVTINIGAKIDVETGGIISVKKPWWSFLAW